MILAVFDCGVVVSALGWDDRYVAAALGAGAAAVVSNDRDLLTLGKPFGIPVVTPVQFLKLVRSR